MSTTTTTHSFTLFVQGVDVLSDASIEALHAAGCDDTTLGSRDGQQYAAFDRDAPGFEEAIASAIHDLTRALPGIAFVRVEPDDLVNMATIAKRAGRSREHSACSPPNNAVPRLPAPYRLRRREDPPLALARRRPLAHRTQQGHGRGRSRSRRSRRRPQRRLRPAPALKAAPQAMSRARLRGPVGQSPGAVAARRSRCRGVRLHEVEREARSRSAVRHLHRVDSAGPRRGPLGTVELHMTMSTAILFTTGYEQHRAPETLVAALTAAGVERLLDVRELPLSRRRGFSKTKLSEALADAGITYEHERALGNPKPLRDLYRSGRQRAGEAGYRAHIRNGSSAAVDELALTATRTPTCLLCFEADHRTCHRTLIVDELRARGVVLDVRHL